MWSFRDDLSPRIFAAADGQYFGALFKNRLAFKPAITFGENSIIKSVTYSLVILL
jgi:hypothetical protein